MTGTTIEWFGATTFRLRTSGITIFLDTWLDRPSVLPRYLAVDDVTEADYIFISHAHFDHLPGADRIAIKTGAIVIANSEAINLLRSAGVPEEQLIPVSGGERIPLFTRAIRDQAKRDEVPTATTLPDQPKMPDHSLASLAVHVWPSLHAFLPNPHPDLMDTAVVYTGEASPYTCTLDITNGMKYGLLQLDKLIPKDKMNDGMRSFLDYVHNRTTNLFSHCDGGQLMFNIVINGNAILWNAHLGAYEGVVSRIEPKPKIALLAIAGRANHDGRPFNGSAAQFAVRQIRWLDQPETVIWCLHDDSCIAPYKVDVTAATTSVEKETSSSVLSLIPGRCTDLDIFTTPIDVMCSLLCMGSFQLPVGADANLQLPVKHRGQPMVVRCRWPGTCCAKLCKVAEMPVGPAAHGGTNQHVRTQRLITIWRPIDTKCRPWVDKFGDSYGEAAYSTSYASGY